MALRIIETEIFSTAETMAVANVNFEKQVYVRYIHPYRTDQVDRRSQAIEILQATIRNWSEEKGYEIKDI